MMGSGEPLRRSVLFLVGVAFAGAVVGKGIRYLIQFVIARGLGPEAVGFFAMGLVVVKIGSRFAQAGLDKAAEKYVSIHEGDGESRTVTGVVLTTVGYSIAFGGVTVVVLVALTELSIGFFDAYRSVIRSFVLAIPLLALMEIGMHATRGFKETKYSVYTREFIQSGVALGCIAVAAFVFTSLQLVIYAYVLSLAVGVVAVGYYLYRLGAFESIGNPNFQSREILLFSLPLLFAGVTSYAASWVDILILGVFASPRAVGVYQIAFQTSMLITIVLNATNVIFPSIIAESYHQRDTERLDAFYISITKWTAYLTCLGAAFVVVFAEEIMRLFGPAFSAGAVALSVLAVGQATVAATGPGGNVLKMTNYERIELYNAAGMLFVNAALNVWLIQLYGVLGAAIATAFSLTLLNVVRLVEVRYFVGPTPYNRSYWKGGLSLVPAVATFVAFSKAFGGPLWIGVAAVTGTIAFGTTITLLGLEDGDRRLLESIGERAG